MTSETGSLRFKRIPWAVGITAGIVLALLAIPSVRWIFLTQLTTLIQPPYAVSGLLSDLGVKKAPAEEPSPQSRRRKQALIDSRPADFEIQLASAVEAGGSDQILARLRAMVTRFPTHAGLRAHILRYAVMGEARMNRDEGYLLSGTPVPSSQPFAMQRSTPEQVAAFDRDAAIGERLAPDNAYFPFMRSCGHFTARRDADGIAAIERAARKPRWDDYAGEEVRARLRMWRAVNGRQSVMQEMVIPAAILFPHYSRLRDAARVAVYRAIVLEQRGQDAEALGIRRALMRLGGKIRAQSATLIGSLVGRALEAISMARAGGAPAEKKPADLDANTWEQRRVQRYAAHLRSLGEQIEARRVEETAHAGRALKEISTRGLEVSPVGRPLVRLMALWVAGMVLLLNAAWMLVMAGAASGMGRVTARPGPILSLWWLGIVLLGATAMAQSAWTEVLAAYWDVMVNLTADAGEGPQTIDPRIARALTVAASLALPFLVPIGAFIAAVRLRRPLAAVLARALAASSWLLMLVYAVVLGLTAAQEAASARALEQFIRHEGRYFASVLHRPWPGEVR